MIVGKPGATRRPNSAAALGVLALVVTMALAPARGASAVSELSPCLDEDEARQALVMLNAMRAEAAPCAEPQAAAAPAPHVHGAPLVWEGRLALAASEMAADLAVRDELSHLDARQRNLEVRLVSAGYPARQAGENLAAGQRDFAQALRAWRRSPTHCATLMERQYSQVGLACVQRSGSRYERFWVAELGLPREP